MVREPQGPSRGLLGDPRTPDPEHVAELLHAGPSRRVGRFPHLRPVFLGYLCIVQRIAH